MFYKPRCRRFLWKFKELGIVVRFVRFASCFFWMISLSVLRLLCLCFKLTEDFIFKLTCTRSPVHLFLIRGMVSWKVIVINQINILWDWYLVNYILEFYLTANSELSWWVRLKTHICCSVCIFTFFNNLVKNKLYSTYIWSKYLPIYTMFQSLIMIALIFTKVIELHVSK